MTDTDDEIYEASEFNGSITVTIKDVSSEPAPSYTITTSSVKVNVISEDIPEDLNFSSQQPRLQVKVIK